jgi:hypothetical protein
MTLRPRRSSSTGVIALDYEIAQEQATALGRMGRALEAALAALSRHDDAGRGHGPARSALVSAASDALWCFLIQRECCGLCDARAVIRAYRVPAEVQNRMGIIGDLARTARR